VRSKAWPVKVGGALPNTQVFTSEREQLGLALHNGQIGPFEPYELYRHTLSKYVEPGEEWLPYGTADPPEHLWTVRRDIGEALTRRARQAAVAAIRGEPVPPGILDPKLIPARVAAIGVTLHNGGVVGCSVSNRKSLDEAVVAAATGAARDGRFKTPTPDVADKIRPAVSALFDPEWIGNTSKEKAARKLRLGRDSIAVQQGEHRAVFLESVAPHYDWGKEQVVQNLLRKAGAADGPAHWTTYRTATWLSGKRGAVPHVFGFAEPPAGPCDRKALRGDLALLGRYIDSNLLPNGLPRYAQTPVPGWKRDQGTAARAVHGLSGLVAAGRFLRRDEWRRRGEEGIRRCLDAVDIAVEIPEQPAAGTLRLDGRRCGPMADCVLLTAAARAGCHGEYGRQMDALAAGVAAMFRKDGSIHPDGQPVRMERDNDFLPNAAMLALASHQAHAPAGLAGRLEPYRAWQLRRFQRLHRWGQAGWLPQACAAVYFATGEPVYAETAFAVADWCLDWQVETTGAFLTDLSPGGPTFHTAFIAEGIADAWALALACGDKNRARLYERAWYSAMRFMRRLIVRPVDAPCFPDPDRSVGGVRCSLTRSTVRIDFVSHLIIAIVKGLSHI
jgi:AMMECR1 domain-containing protein